MPAVNQVRNGDLQTARYMTAAYTCYTHYADDTICINVTCPPACGCLASDSHSCVRACTHIYTHMTPWGRWSSTPTSTRENSSRSAASMALSCRSRHYSLLLRVVFVCRVTSHGIVWIHFACMLLFSFFRSFFSLFLRLHNIVAGIRLAGRTGHEECSHD